MSKLVLETKYETITRGQVVLMVLLTSFIVIGSLFLLSSFSLDEIPAFVYVVIGLYVLVPNGIVLLVSWLKTFTTIQVYQDRVEVVSRFIIKSSRRIEASKIESVDFAESLLGRSRYGMLTVRGTGGRPMVLMPIMQPEEAAEAIRGIADKSSSKEVKPIENTGVSDTNSLSELIAMKQQGHLTEEEFSAAKKKLLG